MKLLDTTTNPTPLHAVRKRFTPSSLVAGRHFNLLSASFTPAPPSERSSHITMKLSVTSITLIIAAALAPAAHALPIPACYYVGQFFKLEPCGIMPLPSPAPAPVTAVAAARPAVATRPAAVVAAE